MKAVIMSDSHRNFQSITDIMAQEPDAGLIIHAGDVHRDVEDIEDAYPEYRIEYVLGNNDTFVQAPSERVFEFGGKKIFLTHGHMYSVKRSLVRLYQRAREVGADICVFGHTHQSMTEERDGIVFINPGSTRSTYAVLQIDRGRITVQIKERYRA